MNDARHSKIVFFVGYIALFYLIGLMLWPFLTSLIFATILAGSFSPLMDLIDKKLERRKLSATIVCFIIIMSVFIPFVFISIKLSDEALLLYKNLMLQIDDGKLEEILFGSNYFPKIVSDVFEMADVKFNAESVKGLLVDTSKEASSAIFNTLNSWISNMFSFLLHFIIMIIVIFTFLVDGSRIKAFILALSPLPDEEEELVIEKFNQINYVTLVGNGIGAVIQGLLAGIGLWLSGIESLTLWTSLMIVLAFIPLVGISIVYIPICIYILVTGDTVTSIVLFIYCTAVSLVVENWFKPRFVGNRAEINSTLIFLSIIGGLAVFGIAGIFYGPLIISIFLTFVELYHNRYPDA